MENISRKNNSLDDMPTRKSLDSLDWYKILSDIGIKNKIKFYNDIVVEKDRHMILVMIQKFLMGGI